MEHVVFFPAPDGAPVFRRVATLEEAVRLVEHLRNVEGVAEVSVHPLGAEVPLAFRAYYRVEVPAEPVAVAVAPVPEPAPALEAVVPQQPAGREEPVAPEEPVALEPLGFEDSFVLEQSLVAVPEPAVEPVAELFAVAEPAADPVAVAADSPVGSASKHEQNGLKSLGFFT